MNKTILNVFCNDAHNNYITIDDKDPVWMNETIRLKIRAKNNMYNKYIQNERSESHFLLLETLKTELNELTNATKDLYYQNLSKRLNNPLLEAKSHWSILKIFYDEKKNSTNLTSFGKWQVCNWY